MERISISASAFHQSILCHSLASITFLDYLMRLSDIVNEKQEASATQTSVGGGLSKKGF